jgi:hypothetical protein
MRLSQVAATMWLQTSSRTVLNLASTRRLIQPFASQFAPFSQAKHLHQSDAVVKSESEECFTVNQPKLEAQNENLDAKSTKEESGLPEDKDDHTATATPRYTRGQHPNSIAARKKYQEEQRALGWPIATSHPNCVAARKKFQEEQRALGWPLLRTNPNVIAGRKRMAEEQRALGFPRLKAATLAGEKYTEEQRAIGFPMLKIAVEKQRASGYREVREKHRANLLRDIEAANKRKLAEDPTFRAPPLPLPDLQVEPPIRSRRGYMICPRPGCNARLKNETTLKIHLRRMHDGGYSEETPHKCKLTSCNQYYETAQKAHEHFRRVHEAVKAKCPLCDRELSSEKKVNRHLREIHYQT